MFQGKFSGVIITILLVVFKQAFAQICVVDTYAGTGLDGFSGDGGDAKSATLDNFFGGVWVDTANTVFIADNRNKRIRTVDKGTKIITTIAGSSLTSFSGEGGQATSAGLSDPCGACSDSTGTLYIAAYGRLQKVDTNGIISTFAGTGTASVSNNNKEGQATSVAFGTFYNCVLDSSANVYLSNAGNYNIRVVTVSTKISSRYAGKGTMTFGGTGDGGPATSAGMLPQSIFMDSTGNLYLSEQSGFRIRVISAGTKIITNYAGSGVNTLSGMSGLATSATIPGGTPFIAGDTSGNLFIGSDSTLYRVIGSSKIISIHTGSDDQGTTNGVCTEATFGLFNQIAVFSGDTTASIYLPDDRYMVRKVFRQFAPTAAPRSPSFRPSVIPSTRAPSRVPTLRPTRSPSQSPSLIPFSSESPSAEPTLSPTLAPTDAPGFTSSPSYIPSPSTTPTAAPVPLTDAPTETPTQAPNTASPGSTSPSQIPSLLPTSAPTLSPSCVPTTAPSQVPTQSPTHAPTLAPTTAAPGTIAPIVSPSVIPSIVPTLKPSALPTQSLKPIPAFTFKPSSQITAPPTASFDGIAVDQPVVIKYVRKGAAADGRRLSLDQLDGSSRNALIAAAASVLDLSVSAVSIVDEYLVDTNSTTGLSRIAVTFRFLVQDSDFPQQSFTSPRALFTFVTTSFAQSVSVAAFNTALNAAAAQYQAAELLEHNAQHDSTVTVTQPTYTEVDTYDPMDAGLSTGEYAGVVIGVLVGFIVLGAIVFLLFKRRNEESESEMPTTQV